MAEPRLAEKAMLTQGARTYSTDKRFMPLGRVI